MDTHQTEREVATPVDEAAELRLVKRYVRGSMTTTQARAFDERLAADAPFYARVRPVLDEWYLGLEGSAPLFMDVEARRRVARFRRGRPIDGRQGQRRGRRRS